MAGLAVVIALVGTPSVVAACAMLCLPFTSHHTEPTARADADVAASPEAHADCHGSQAADTTPPVEALTTITPAQSLTTLSGPHDHDCCPDTLGLPAVSAPGSRASADQLTTPPAALVYVGHRPDPARARAPAGPHPSRHAVFSPSRLPLVLRI